MNAKLFIISWLMLFICSKHAHAQALIYDEAMRYQQERMVFKQWDQNKFKPGSGFLGLSPWYWLTWGLFEPNYHKNDLRPLSSSGPQTQRLGLAGTMNTIDNTYKLYADTLKTTGLSLVANESGLLTPVDPLWLLYYSNELKPLVNFTSQSIMAQLPAKIRETPEGQNLYGWYIRELESLKERLDGARSANMDRGARIMAYHRLLQEYRTLVSAWETRTATASKHIALTEKQQQLKSGQVGSGPWTPQTDVDIAKKVLADRKY